MRIIAGNLKGQNFNSPSGHHTHPMSEKIRGAIFNALGDIEGLSLLDAFAGSGAISLEAISRGVASVVAVDVTKEAYGVIKENSQKLKVEDKVKVIRANVSGWSDNNKDWRFDVVIADPPHDMVPELILEHLSIHVKTGGLYILSLPTSSNFVPTGFMLLSEKTYDDVKILFYRLESRDSE